MGFLSPSTKAFSVLGMEGVVKEEEISVSESPRKDKAQKMMGLKDEEFEKIKKKLSKQSTMDPSKNKVLKLMGMEHEELEKAEEKIASNLFTTQDVKNTAFRKRVKRLISSKGEKKGIDNNDTSKEALEEISYFPSISENFITPR